MVTPSCANPVEIDGTWSQESEGYIIDYDSSIICEEDLIKENELHVRARSGQTLVVGRLSAETVSRLRCTRGVKAIAHDSVMRVNAGDVIGRP